MFYCGIFNLICIMEECTKFSKLGFNSLWTENFQVFKMDLEKKEEPEIKLLIFIGSWKKQQSSRRTPTSASLTTLKPLTVWIITNWKILQEIRIPDQLTCLLRNLYASHEATVRMGHGTTDWFQTVKEYIKALYCHSAYLTSMQSTSWKRWAGGSTGWNQDCREKFQ